MRLRAQVGGAGPAVRPRHREPGGYDVLLSSDPTVGLADILQSLPAAVVVAAADGRVVHANPALTPLLGLDPDELVGSTLSVLMPERLRSAHDRGFARFCATGER